MTQPQQTPPPSKSGSDMGVVKIPSKDDFNISGLVENSYVEQVLAKEAEAFGAIELSQVLQADTIFGDTPNYSIVSNLSNYKTKNNPSSILTNSNKNLTSIKLFSISLVSKIPDSDYLEKNLLDETYQYLDENNATITKEKGYVYIDSNGDLIIELNNMRSDEFIEIQIDENGTIYEVNN